MRQLAAEGVEIHAGERIRYVIRDYGSGGSKRAVPFDFLEAKDYDPKRYVKLLAEGCASVLKGGDSRYNAESLVGVHEHWRGLEGLDKREVADLTNDKATRRQAPFSDLSSPVR